MAGAEGIAKGGPRVGEGEDGFHAVQPTIDGPGVRERGENPGPEQRAGCEAVLGTLGAGSTETSSHRSTPQMRARSSLTLSHRTVADPPAVTHTSTRDSSPPGPSIVRASSAAPSIARRGPSDGGAPAPGVGDAAGPAWALASWGPPPAAAGSMATQEKAPFSSQALRMRCTWASSPHRAACAPSSADSTGAGSAVGPRTEAAREGSMRATSDMLRGRARRSMS